MASTISNGPRWLPGFNRAIAAPVATGGHQRARPVVCVELDPRLVAVGRPVRVRVPERPGTNDHLDVDGLAGLQHRQGGAERDDLAAAADAEDVDRERADEDLLAEIGR